MIRVQGIRVVADRLSAMLKPTTTVKTLSQTRRQRTRQSLSAKRPTTAKARSLQQSVKKADASAPGSRPLETVLGPASGNRMRSR